MCTTETREQKATTPAQRVAWGKIAKADKVVFTGDMNAHSKMWIWKTTRPSNNVSWERLVEDNDLVIWNTQEETKMGEEVERHSFNDPTQASPGAELAWRICRDQATVSNYKLIRWEVLRPPPPPPTRGWICAWRPPGGISAGGTQRGKRGKRGKRQSGKVRKHRSASSGDVGTARPLIVTVPRMRWTEQPQCCGRLWWAPSTIMPD